MRQTKLERLMTARTTYDRLCVMAPSAARYLRMMTPFLLPTEKREHVMSARGGSVKLARAFLDAPGGSPEERALNAYRAAWERSDWGAPVRRGRPPSAPATG